MKKILLMLSVLVCLTGCGNKEVVNDVNKEVPNETKQEHIVLYRGYEMRAKTGVQYLSDMKITDEANKKFNIEYFNYENGKSEEKTKGIFGEETFEGVSKVENVKKIAVSTEYNAIPREYEVINELPNELIDMADYSKIQIEQIDLDGDGNIETFVTYGVDYKVGEIGDDGEPKASSGIMMFDSEYKKIDDLVTLDNGFWGNIKEEDRKVFITMDNLEYIDIDNDGSMEVIIEVPTYEGTIVSVLKYKDGKLEGETNIKASVAP